MKIKTLLLILMVGYVIFKLLSYFIIPLIYFAVSEEQGITYDLIGSILGTADIFIAYFFNIVIGVILYRITKSEKALWLFMGVIFGLMALILFFVIDKTKAFDNQTHNEGN